MQDSFQNSMLLVGTATLMLLTTPAMAQSYLGHEYEFEVAPIDIMSTERSVYAIRSFFRSAAEVEIRLGENVIPNIVCVDLGRVMNRIHDECWMTDDLS